MNKYIVITVAGLSLGSAFSRDFADKAFGPFVCTDNLHGQLKAINYTRTLHSRAVPFATAGYNTFTS